MDLGEQKPQRTGDAVADEREIRSVGLSRRDFTRRFGAGSAVTVGMVWAAPKISTIRYATKVAAGSPPPATTTTTTFQPPPGGAIRLSTQSPCVGDVVTVNAGPFTPHTAVRLELDSPETTLMSTTADGSGNIAVAIQLSQDVRSGPHLLKVIGVVSGGKNLTLTAHIRVKSVEECQVAPEGSTTTAKRNQPSTTVSPSTATSTPPTSEVRPEHPVGPPHVSPESGSNALAFTGTDAIDLALIGAAAAVGGRALYGLVRRHDDEDEDEE